MKLVKNWAKKKWVSYTIATCSAVVLYMILSNLSGILGGLDSVYGYVKPVVTALIIAYVFNPFARLFYYKVFKKMKNENLRWKLSVACALIAILMAVILLFVALIPQLVDSVATFIDNLDGYVNTLQGLMHSSVVEQGAGLLGGELSTVANVIDGLLDKISGYLSENMGSVVTTSANVGKSVFDVVIAFILAIYILLDKSRLKKGFERFTKLLMRPESHANAANFLDRCNTIIIRYISFDIVDGIIVGIVNMVFMLVAGIPYSVLISVIVAITNLAPTFGPIVGAAIGAFILVLVNPWYALSFLIFTLILQAIDGYILKPRLFGGSLGVSPLMILISIIVGGRLFGVGGILLAIPFAAIIDFVWRDYVLKKLEERHKKRYDI